MSLPRTERAHLGFGASLVGAREPDVLIADIGGTWTRVAMGGATIEQSEIFRFQTMPHYPDMINKLGNVAAVLLDGKKAHAVGFGIAGQVEGGVITKAGKLQEYGYVGRDIAEDVAHVMGIDRANVAGMNDLVAAARAEQKARANGGSLDMEAIYTLSTGLGGARFNADMIIPDEPGHEFLRLGAVCGCGGEGCLEAHVSGSGIERKFGVRGEHIPPGDARWAEVTADLITGVDQMLTRYEADGGIPNRLSFFGSVAMHAPGVLDGLYPGLQELRDEVPAVGYATYGDDSGLYGAYFAGMDTLV